MKYALLVAALLLTGCDSGTPVAVQPPEPAPPPVSLDTPYDLRAWNGEALPAPADLLVPYGYDADIRYGGMQLNPDGVFIVKARIAYRVRDGIGYADMSLVGQTFPLGGDRVLFKYEGILIEKIGLVLMADAFDYEVEGWVYEDAIELDDGTTYTRTVP